MISDRNVFVACIKIEVNFSFSRMAFNGLVSKANEVLTIPHRAHSIMRMINFSTFASIFMHAFNQIKRRADLNFIHATYIRRHKDVQLLCLWFFGE